MKNRLQRVLLMLVVMGLSCLPDTETYECASGRRCKAGQVCALNQDVCIDLGGCGDGVVDGSRGEVCDDGNIEDRDGCSADCGSDETCGNGITDMTVGETCDDGNRVSGDACSAECQFEACGNSTIDLVRVVDPVTMEARMVMEVCDDGNAVSGDGCRKDCLSNEVCGNGLIDWEEDGQGNVVLGEQCDPGMPGMDTAECNADCTVPVCGDGVFNPEYQVTPEEPAECPADVEVCPYNEQCDTGGDTDICDADCTIPICGDGYVNAAIEDCDPGPDMLGENTSECNANCKVAMCGDGFFNYLFMVDPGDGGDPYAEQCDDGGDSAGCDGDCTEPECGDGYWNPEFTVTSENYKEECDDGNDDNEDDCVAGCKANVCGDGFVDREGPEIEECDDKNQANNDDCLNTCKLNKCGDGFLDEQGPDREQCDDGNQVNEDGCSSVCKVERCGDGVIQQGRGEQCENGISCTDANLRCDQDCHCL